MLKPKLILSLSVFLLAVLACNDVAPRVEPRSTLLPPTINPELTVIVEPTSASKPTSFPLSEERVDRIPVQGAWTMQKSDAVVIVDVRSTEAYAASHIKGAISIPLAEIENNPTGLELDKDQWIITYCAWMGEHTSARAAFVLLNNGYKRVNPILGGFQAWIDAGYPVEP